MIIEDHIKKVKGIGTFHYFKDGKFFDHSPVIKGVDFHINDVIRLSGVEYIIVDMMVGGGILSIHIKEKNT